MSEAFAARLGDVFHVFAIVGGLIAFANYVAVPIVSYLIGVVRDFHAYQAASRKG